MQTADTIRRLAGARDLEVSLEFDEAEQQFVVAFGDALPPLIELYGLAAVEAAIFRDACDDRLGSTIIVDSSTYGAAVSKFFCSPLHGPRCLEAPTMADVIPFRGDQRKLFGADVPQDIATAPTVYAEFANELNRQFGDLSGVDAYERLVRPLIEFQCGLWLTRAMVLTRPDDHMTIVDESINEYLDRIHQ